MDAAGSWGEVGLKKLEPLGNSKFGSSDWYLNVYNQYIHDIYLRF